MSRATIEKRYDDFFGEGYWEREYKKHIVEFAVQERAETLKEVIGILIKEGILSGESTVLAKLKELE